MTGDFEVLANPLSHVWVHGNGITLVPFASNPESVESAILVQILNLQRNDLGSAESYLKTDCENGSVA